jgi:hypothetical protein
MTKNMDVLLNILDVVQGLIQHVGSVGLLQSSTKPDAQ